MFEFCPESRKARRTLNGGGPIVAEAEQNESRFRAASGVMDTHVATQTSAPQGVLCRFESGIARRTTIAGALTDGVGSATASPSEETSRRQDANARIVSQANTRPAQSIRELAILTNRNTRNPVDVVVDVSQHGKAGSRCMTVARRGVAHVRIDLSGDLGQQQSITIFRDLPLAQMRRPMGNVLRVDSNQSRHGLGAIHKSPRMRAHPIGRHEAVGIRIQDRPYPATGPDQIGGALGRPASRAPCMRLARAEGNFDDIEREWEATFERLRDASRLVRAIVQKKDDRRNVSGGASLSDGTSQSQ